MPVRAKFRCDSITLRRSSRTNPEVLAALDGPHPRYAQIQEVAKERGIPTSVDFDQPSVALSPVISGPDSSDEDESFWDATPSGKIEMTITNPSAAETFELGETYYVDFTPAD